MNNKAVSEAVHELGKFLAVVFLVLGFLFLMFSPPTPHTTLASLAPTIDQYAQGEVMCKIAGKNVNVIAVEGNYVIIVDVRPNDGTYFPRIQVEDTEEIVCIDPRYSP